jgi:hypothetical protein
LLKTIKEQFLNKPSFSTALPIALSVWILSLTAYFCINTPWFDLFGSGRADTKQLIADVLKFHWVSAFLSRLPYLFYALILNLIALLIGNRILRWLKVDLDYNINKIVFSLPLGWSIYSIGIFYLGVSGLLYKEAVYCFLVFLGVLSILEIERFFREWKALSSTSRFKMDKSDLVFLPVIIIFLAVQLVTSFSPVWSIDALVYHMGLPKLYMQHHTLVHVPGFLYSTLPAHTEMLYLLGLITSGETLSKLFCFSISLIFLLSIFSIGNKHFSKEAGYLAAITFVIVSPIFSGLFSEPYIDTSFGLFTLVGIYAFFMWLEERRVGYLYLSIINCALAAAVKIHGLFFVLLFFVGFLATVKMDRQFLKKLAWCIFAVGIIALPWYIRSWWLTGDPVFPFLYNYLGANHWNEYSKNCLEEFVSFYKSGIRSFSVFFPGNAILSPSSVIFIFWISALIALWNKNKLIMYLFVITLVYFIFLSFTHPRGRYFYVGLASMSIIGAHFIKIMWTKHLLMRISIILCLVVSSIATLCHSVSLGWIEGPFFAGLGVLDRRQFLNESQYKYLRDSYKVSTWVNETLPQDSKILTWYHHGYHLEREFVMVHPGFQSILNFGTINDAPTFLKSIKKLAITHLIYEPTGWMTPGLPKEFLDKYVFELLESGKIALIKQIDNCTIYSLVPPNYFVHDGNTIKFYDESHRRHLVKGWSSTEEWGTWSEGEESLIILNFTKPKDYTMLISATGFAAPSIQQSVSIYLDDNLLGKHTFTQPTTHFEDFKMKIPSAYIKEGNQQIRFVYSFTGYPAEHGMGPDVRQLAMGVSTIEFR